MDLAIRPKTAESLFHPRWRAGSKKRTRRSATKTTTVIPSVSEGPGWAGGAPPEPPGPSLTLGMTVGSLLTHRFRIDAVAPAELAIGDRRDLARLDLAAPAPKHVRVEHRDVDAGQVLVDGAL